MSGYTPGPWKEKDGVVYSADNRYIYRPDYSTMGVMPSEREANAYLITAAPTLLEAVKALLHAMEMQEGREDGSLLIPQDVAWHIWSEAKDKAIAAIARAEGKAE